MQNLLWQAGNIAKDAVYYDYLGGPVAWIDARDIADPGNMGSGGLAMLAVMEARDASPDLTAGGNHLPGDEEESS